MFEFLMLIGFLGAGFSHWRPEMKRAKGQPPEGEKEGLARKRRCIKKEGPVARKFSLGPDRVLPAKAWG